MVKRGHFGSSWWLWFGVLLCFNISEISQSTHSSLSAASLTGTIHALSWGAAFIAATYWGKRNDDKGDSFNNFVCASLICGITIFALIWVSNLWLVLVTTHTRLLLCSPYSFDLTHHFSKNWRSKPRKSDWHFE